MFCHSVSYANSTAEKNNIQFEYYKTSSNIKKKLNGSYECWWERSPYTSSNNRFCYVGSTGVADWNTAISNSAGFAPFGVI